MREPDLFETEMTIAGLVGTAIAVWGWKKHPRLAGAGALAAATIVLAFLESEMRAPKAPERFF
jgi:hypothetical protein